MRDAQGKNKWCDGISGLQGTEKRCKETPRCAHGKKYRCMKAGEKYERETSDRKFSRQTPL